MRILQVVQKPQRRGAEVFAYQMSEALEQQGHQTRLLYLYPYNGPGALPVKENARLLAGAEAHRFEALPGIHPQLLAKVLQQIKDFQPDVVQVNGGRAVKYGAFARYRHPQALWALVYRNIGNPYDWVQGWRQRLFYRNIVMPRLDGVVGVSQTTLQIVKDFYGLSVPMVYIPRGVDPNALVPRVPPTAVREKWQTPATAPLLLFVGSLTPEKRLDRLLRLFHDVRADWPDLHLWIVGDGPLRKALEEQVANAGTSHCIHFLGVQEDVATYIQAATLFLLTSDTEGTPGVLLEAGLLGLPVVATRVGGVAECVQDGQTGLLVEPQNEQTLSTSVRLLLGDAARRHQLGENAQQWIQSQFTMSKVVDAYLKFYQMLLKQRNQYKRSSTSPAISVKQANKG